MLPGSQNFVAWNSYYLQLAWASLLLWPKTYCRDTRALELWDKIYLDSIPLSWSEIIGGKVGLALEVKISNNRKLFKPSKNTYHHSWWTIYQLKSSLNPIITLKLSKAGKLWSNGPLYVNRFESLVERFLWKVLFTFDKPSLTYFSIF